MDNQPVIKAAIQSAVSQGLRDIRRDPNRGVRKLVDLGVQFGRGRNQQNFFSDAQALLKNKNSTYYALIKALTQKVEPKTLETFFVNLGYMSWTQGANIIRDYESSQGVNVPWTLMLQLNSAGGAMDLYRLIDEGQRLGLYAYTLFVGEQTADFETVFDLTEAFPCSAFGLLSQDEAANARLAATDRALPNVMLLPRGRLNDLANVSLLLSQKRRMAALNCEYNDQNADDLFAPAFLEQVVGLNYPFLFLLPSNDCSQATRERVHAKVQRLRDGQHTPLFPVDYYADQRQVDHRISDEGCLLMLDADGRVLLPRNSSAALNGSLETLLHQTMPRVRR